MTDEKHNYLLEAVEALANPIVTKVIQDGPIGSGLAGQQIIKVTQAPLLQQLDEAIRGTIGIGGSGALASQRNVLDADALHRFAVISSTIKDWARMVKAEVTPDAVTNLKRWYAIYSDRNGTEKFYSSQMGGWKSQIEDKLNPARIRELPDACPLCGASDWFDPADKLRYLHPLIVKYRPSGADMIQEAEALCRSCAAVWGVRQLAYELEQIELAKAVAAEATA